MSWKERLLGLTVHGVEAVIRPGAKRHAAKRHNFFLPQFQAALGTPVHATPVVEVLKASVPGARIVVAASGLAHQVWQGNPHVELLLNVPNPVGDLNAAVKAVRAAHLFGGEPYTTLFTIGNERTNVSLLSMLAGPSRRIGFAVHSGLLNCTLKFDPAISQIENNLRTLTAAGVPLAHGADREPKIYPGAEPIGVTLPVRDGKLRIALATQTSVTQRKKWRNERWIAVITELRVRYGAEFVFIGTKAEAPAIDELRKRVPFETSSLAGRTTIRELAAALQQCDLGIMLDTGPLHVGRAVQLPIVVIAPGWSPEIEWLPVGNPRYRILKKSDFGSPVPGDYIIDEVSIEDVLQATEELLTTTARSQD